MQGDGGVAGLKRFDAKQVRPAEGICQAIRWSGQWPKTMP
jgi:hypothetical protein